LLFAGESEDEIQMTIGFNKLSSTVFAARRQTSEYPQPSRECSHSNSLALVIGMARWRRRSYNKGNKDQAGQNETSVPKSAGFSDSAKTVLKKYLIDYRNGCKRVCFSDESCHSDEETVVTAPAANKKLTNGGQETSVEIGNHQFPALTDVVFALPYLALPKTLTSKQRRAVHALCVDVDLFHCGVGPNRENRYIVISIHSDGLRYVGDLKEYPPEPSIPVRRCRPWYHRMDHPDITADELMTPTKTNSSIHPYVEESTRKGRAKIEALLDQPGQCLRDDVDKLDFKQMEAKDLSDIDPPGIGEDESWMLVDTAEKMHQCVRELEEARPTEIALDMEMYNPSKFAQVTCLVQLSSNVGKEYVIDTLAPGVWDYVSLLKPLFADPAIIKVGHSIGSLDVRSLHRDFGIFVVNAFDTYEAAEILKLPCGLGLASVCQHYGLANVKRYRELKAKYQTTDWRRRPLTDDMIRYGRYDVHFLLALRRLMIRDLTREELWDNVGFNSQAERRMIAETLASSIKRMGREEDGEIVDHENDLDVSTEEYTVDSNISDDEGYFTPPTQEDPTDDATRHSEYNADKLRMQADLMRVISHSQQRCLDLWSLKAEVPTKNETFVSVIYRAGKGELEWSPPHMALYEDLVHWRDVVARKEGVLPSLVCSLQLLVSVALKRPTCEASLRRISYFLPELLEDTQEDYLGQILSLVRSSLEKNGLNPVSFSIQKYSAPESKSSLRKRGVALSLAAIAVIGTVTVVAIALSRRRRL
jgi:ribonuclease D